MQITFDIMTMTDGAGVAMYRASFDSDADADGILDPSAPRGWGETVWDAISQLIDQLDGVDPLDVLSMGEEAL